MSDWLSVLSDHCRKTSQSRVATRLGVSAAMVNQALQGKYQGDLARLRERVAGAFMDAAVDCPVLGILGRDECISHQERPFAATNPIRVQLFRACRNGCPYSLIGGADGQERCTRDE